MTKLAKVSKRGDQNEQIRLLTQVFSVTTIQPSLPYTPQIAAVLREAIVGLQLMPGTSISEAAIAEVLGLSRTPVREALKDLSVENLVNIFPQAGTVVAPIRLSLIEQGSFVRKALESANLLDLMDLLTPQSRGRIKALLTLQERALKKQDVATFHTHDDAMHRLFFELTDRLPTWSIVQNSKQQVDRARLLLIHDDINVCANAFAEHKKIVDALFAGNRRALSEALDAHITGVSLKLSKYVARTHSSMVSA
jgi:DNA-binding GntR family transcriptional regulator